MSERLTTQFLYKRWANQATPSGTSAGDDPVLQAMIDIVSDAVAARLDRKFETATIREWLNGTGTRVIQLRLWPVRQIYGLGVSSQDVLEIENTTAQYASCYVSETGLSLQSVTSGVQTLTAELTWATYPTITLLAAAVAAVSGWTSSVMTGMGDQPSNMIRPGLTGYCVSPDTFTLEIPDEIEECRLCANTERSVERRFGSVFPAGLSNIFAWYRAGYTLPVDNSEHSNLATAGDVPGDLTQAVNTIVKAVIDGSDDLLGGSQGGSVGGDYSYTLTEGGRSILSKAIDEAMPVLQRYRRLALGF